jgi:hypothetical protein
MSVSRHPPLAGGFGFQPRRVAAAELLGIAKPRRRRHQVKTVFTLRECGQCGGAVTSAAGFFCAACHFDGWWGKWA